MGKEALKMLQFGFNQDQGCLFCGTNAGFRVYNCDPFQEKMRRDFKDGGIGYVEMLFRCNIFALVGGGDNPKFAPSKVMIWDDHQNRCIGELSFRSQVRAVKLRRERIVVALEHKVLVYDFKDLKLLHSIETLSNPMGLVALSPSQDQTVMACPGLHCGQVRVELYDVRRTKFVEAHTTSLACLALSLDGKLLATASERGTLVRVFSTTDGSKLQELRRGADPARIFSIAFSRGDIPEFVAVSSDKGHCPCVQPGPQADSCYPIYRCHIHTDRGQQSKEPCLSAQVCQRKLLSFLPVPYFASERSFAQFRLPEDTKAVVGFGPSNSSLIVASASGSFFTASFDSDKGGICKQESFCKFVELDS
ncbi:MAG: WD repeat domain phosphoinositide-interacting 3-like [Trebouxia sp. A1-2]|nr:MAG: WD repeat domain phosphoinositide-interacting 3-like [Trebouxia sp. A1-2]